MATERNTDEPKAKPRPIVRLGLFLISHSFFFSVVCCIAGVLALLLLPVLAKNTYISENALMPGSANSMLSSQDMLKASELVNDITDLKLRPAEAGREIPKLLARYMSELGAEVNYHKFHPPSNQFQPLHFFSNPDFGMIQEKHNGSSYGINTVGIIRAPSGDGKEAIVLVTAYNSKNICINEAVSLGIAFSVFSLLSRVTWLAKDIIWLAADSKYGEYAPVSAWLRDYHTPVFSWYEKLNAEMCFAKNVVHKHEENQITERKITDVFRRAGTMAAALVIRVADKKEQGEDTLTIYAEASNGQMPNLDLLNIVNYLSVHKQGMRVKVEKLWSLLDSSWLKLIGDLLEFVDNVARSYNPQWKFGISATDYVEGTATLASSLYSQALGVPTGPHGGFRDYQVDAITLEISPQFPLNNKFRRNEFLLRSGRLIEGVVRSVNNLLEKFHQSFFLYLLTSPNKFVSVGVYMIGFLLLIAPLPIAAAAVYAYKLDPSSISQSSTSKSWKWISAVKQVFVVHLWGVIVSLLPHFIYQIPNLTPTLSVVAWILLSALSLIVLYVILGSSFSCKSPPGKEKEWAILKAVTISTAFIGLCLMSVINFATAEIGALFLVPICLMTHPLKLDVRAKSLKGFIRAACNLLLGVMVCPAIAFFVMKSAFGGLDDISPGELWKWVESLWAWNSATYLYLALVYLPCWALCLRILFHPC